MTIYNVPLSDSQASRCIHIRSARKQYGYWFRTGNSSHETLMWLQLIKAVFEI